MAAKPSAWFAKNIKKQNIKYEKIGGQPKPPNKLSFCVGKKKRNNFLAMFRKTNIKCSFKKNEKIKNNNVIY